MDKLSAVVYLSSTVVSFESLSELISNDQKVIAQCEKNALASRSWKYDTKQKLTEQSGSGNNWAFGYNVHGNAVFENFLDLVQTEIDHCQSFGGFLILQSVAGGTGSGLGSYITEQLRDYFPSSYILNVVIWPYQSGEVIVQNYNAVLTMAAVSQASDAVLIFENDIANRICERLLNIKSPSFSEMNLVIANHLASVFLSSSVGTENDGSSSQNLLHLLLDHLCPHPGFKLLNIKMIPQIPNRSKDFSTHQWKGILKHLHQMQLSDSGLEEGMDWNLSVRSKGFNITIAGILTLRGANARSTNFELFSNPNLYTSWNPCSFLSFHSEHSFNNDSKTASFISNSQSTTKPLREISEKAIQMFEVGAYLHQYSAHGVEGDQFEQSFLKVEQIVKSYESLSP